MIGKLLIQARARVKDGEWIAWCEKNIKRSERDIRKCMAIAGSNDPHAALANERERNREVNREYRERKKERAHVRPVPNEDRQAAADESYREADTDEEIHGELDPLVAEALSLVKRMDRPQAHAV